MSLSADWREFIELLNSRGVEYVIVGAHSLAFHGRPRYTGDLDLLVRPSRENAARLSTVLHEFGFGKSGFKESDFAESGQVIQLGRAPYRIDLLTSISGVATDDAFQKKIATEMDGLPVFVLSKEMLIRNKRAVARPQDIADLAELEGGV
jgi:predicted nucleotidyltransferase